MKFLSLLLTLSFVFFTGPALAARVCYEPEQVEAEQWLRLHSELMVITVTCRQGANGQDLSAPYVHFTKTNISVLHNAEQTLIAYYKKNERGDPQDRLDRLRTKLGNEFAQKAADMSSPAFCAAFRDKVLMFDAASSEMVQGEVKRMQVYDRTSIKPCHGPATAMAKKG